LENREREPFAGGGDEMFGDKAPRRYQRRRPRQVIRIMSIGVTSIFCAVHPERGKIMPRRISGISLAKDQRR
jgi:hypothetical protein